MIKPWQLENRTPDPADRKEDGDYFALCVQCGEPILYDEGSWESEYFDTVDGPCHVECGLEYYRTYIDVSAKIARRDMYEPED